jgi:hypothetical protein
MEAYRQLKKQERKTTPTVKSAGRDRAGIKRHPDPKCVAAQL